MFLVSIQVIVDQITENKLPGQRPQNIKESHAASHASKNVAAALRGNNYKDIRKSRYIAISSMHYFTRDLAKGRITRACKQSLLAAPEHDSMHPYSDV